MPPPPTKACIDRELLSVPNRLFFDKDGIITLLDSYKFTLEENTPIDQDVALDPELLGKAFENLLAAHNPETRTTARKRTGSYYTPRPHRRLHGQRSPCPLPSRSLPSKQQQPCHRGPAKTTYSTTATSSTKTPHRSPPTSGGQLSRR